jgi:hypothetical protein
MNNVELPSGSCLCGKVTFQTTSEPLEFRYCACKSCQKTTGSAHAANFTVPVDSLIWKTGEDLIVRFVEQKDNPGFNTWFCSECGSFLPHTSRSGRLYIVPAGSLDTQIALKPKDVVFWEESPDWYISMNELQKHLTRPSASDNVDKPLSS